MPRRDDPKRPAARVQIADFGGFEPNSDPHDLAPGVATHQINATSVKRGELRVRQGYRVVQFEGD
jgi:hypothetical protein